jgi:hypothetical protein
MKKLLVVNRLSKTDLIVKRRMKKIASYVSKLNKKEEQLRKLESKRNWPNKLMRTIKQI